MGPVIHPRTICCVQNRDPVDHSCEIAKIFVDHYKCNSVVLKLDELDENYKTQGRKNRYEKRRARWEGSGYPEPIWFVDDVYTTGATASAVWKALGRPQNYRVITMIYKKMEEQCSK